jgi:ELWxxDGT repeat protein
MTEVGGTVFFTPDTPTTGDELWKSDGTEAGTVRVKDIRPGSAGSSPQSLTDLNGTLYFFAYDGTSGGLWKSDGTEVGTVRVKDIWEEGRLSDLRHLTNVNGTLYFSANDGIHGDELWTSDGTEAGTVMVAELAEGSGGSGPGLFTEVAGKLFFVASDDLHGGELWVADLGVSNDDRNRDGLIDVRDLDALCTALGDGTTTRETIEDFWARQNTGPGDANFDHVFDRFDLVAVLQRGKYETNSAASWNDGDFNCDGLFSRLDLVAALQRGWYQSL